MNPFVADKKLTAIALGYKNEGFIADMVAPRTPVLSETFKWTEYNSDEMLTIPNTMVGRKGRVNQVEFTATEKSDSVLDYGLEDVIPMADVNAAKGHPSINPEGNISLKLSELISLGREKRIANTVMNAANHTHNEVITGTDKWTDPASKPIEQITDAMNTPLVTPNTLVLGVSEALALRRNVQIVKAFHGNDGQEGLVPLSFIEQLFNVKILVGVSRHNSQREGQTAVIERLWTGGAALLYIKPAAQLRDDLTYMLTAEYETRVSGSWEDKNVGLRGGKVVRVGESVKEVLMAKAASYFLQSVI